MFCPTCGHEQKTQGAFCPKCGTNLQNLVTKEPTVARPASAASADQATTQTAAQPTGQPAAQPSGQSTTAAAWLRDPKALIALDMTEFSSAFTSSISQHPGTVAW